MVKQYPAADVERLLSQVDAAGEEVSRLSDTMTNGEPWAAHWLGGDCKNGATEVRPKRFQRALDAVREASNALQTASHELAMLRIETEGGG